MQDMNYRSRDTLSGVFDFSELLLYYLHGPIQVRDINFEGSRHLLGHETTLSSVSNGKESSDFTTWDNLALSNNVLLLCEEDSNYLFDETSGASPSFSAYLVLAKTFLHVTTSLNSNSGFIRDVSLSSIKGGVMSEDPSTLVGMVNEGNLQMVGLRESEGGRQISLDNSSGSKVSLLTWGSSLLVVTIGDSEEEEVEGAEGIVVDDYEGIEGIMEATVVIKLVGGGEVMGGVVMSGVLAICGDPGRGAEELA
eukprot:Gb_16656 [translate_table: standard]